MGESTLYHADLTAWLRGRLWLVQNGYIPKFHAVFCDPPYFLGSISKRFGKPGAAPAQYGKDGAYSRQSRGFMGKTWDGFESPWHYQEWVTEWATLLLDFLYPGAVVAMFGGTRTYHRLAAGLEDAGFEVFDCIMYLYGSGFPKSHDISKAIDRAAGAEREIVDIKRSGFGKRNGVKDEDGGIFLNSLPEDLKQVGVTAPATPDAALWDGFGTALKPAYEPILLARAPRGKHTFAQMAQQYGSGALNIDRGRIETDGRPKREKLANLPSTGIYGEGLNGSMAVGETLLGRWPANIILDEIAAEMLDEQSGESVSKSAEGVQRYGRSGGIMGNVGALRNGRPEGHDDSGGASRFFYTAKASSFEREAGLHHHQQTTVNDGRQTPIDNPYQRGETKRRNIHPTVKPIRLTEYISRLLLPPTLDTPRRILIPFGGVGSEVIGALFAGWDQVVSIEREAEYIPLHRERVQWWAQFKTYEQAEAAYKADVNEQTQRENERAQGLQQLTIFDLVTQEVL